MGRIVEDEETRPMSNQPFHCTIIKLLLLYDS
jgi:hypothetical protein